jgi:hypothetical protein
VYYAQYKAAGYKVIGITWPPRTTPAFNAARAQVNTAIRGWLVTGEIDALADLAADPVYGPDAAASDPTKYPDGIHPDAVGHAVFETIVRPLVNAFPRRRRWNLGRARRVGARRLKIAAGRCYKTAHLSHRVKLPPHGSPGLRAARA